MFVHLTHTLRHTMGVARAAGGVSPRSASRPSPRDSVARLCVPAQLGHVIGRRAPLDDCRDMLAPGVERQSLLLRP
jgi:hypothetical protein